MDRLRAITFFCRAVERSSFSRAAQDLEVMPSAVSKAIAGLETELGCRLFNRSTRRLSLTEAGATYYERCHQAVLELEDAAAAARSGSAAAVGTLRIGLHPALRLALLGSLPQFLAAHPGIGVEMVISNAPATLLVEGLDVLLRIGAPPDSSLVAPRLGWTSRVVCAAPGYLEGRATLRTPADFARCRAIIPARADEESFARWQFARGAERMSVSVPVCLVVRDGIGLVDAARVGVGLAQVYEIAARADLAAGRLNALLPDWSCGRMPVHAVLPTRRGLPGKVRAFVDFARATLLATGQG